MAQDVRGHGSAQRLHEFADRQGITDLIGRLGMVLDEMRLEELREVFTEDAVGEFPSGTLRGVSWSSTASVQTRRSIGCSTS